MGKRNDGGSFGSSGGRGGKSVECDGNRGGFSSSSSDMDVTEYASSVVYGEEGLLEGLEEVKEEAPSKMSSSFSKKSMLESQFNNSATTSRSSSFAQRRSSGRRRDEQSSILA